MSSCWTCPNCSLSNNLSQDRCQACFTHPRTSAVKIKTTLNPITEAKEASIVSLLTKRKIASKHITGKYKKYKKEFKLVIGRLPYKAKSDDVKIHLGTLNINISNIKSIALEIANRKAKVSVKKYAIVEFYDELSMMKAMKLIENSTLMDVELRTVIYNDKMRTDKYKRQQRNLHKILNKKKRYNNKNGDYDVQKAHEQKFCDWLWYDVNLEEYLALFQKWRVDIYGKIGYIDEELLRALHITNSKHINVFMSAVNEHKQRCMAFDHFLQQKQNKILLKYEEKLRVNAICTLKDLRFDLETVQDVKHILAVDERDHIDKIIQITHTIDLNLSASA